jgi:hypothetical protein
MAQSPELAGGAGFTFEGTVAAYYLVSLLAESHAPGIDSRRVVRVSVQQRDLGSPLDDLIVDFAGRDGEEARLSLQCKRKLVISAAQSNADFLEVVSDGWGTFSSQSFRHGIDRVGVAVAEVAMHTSRALRALCEIARSSPSLCNFQAQLAPEGPTNATIKQVHADVAILLERCSDGVAGPADVHKFLAHFVLLEFDFLHAGARDHPRAIDQVAGCLASPNSDKAPLLWSHLQVLARAGAGTAAVFDRVRLLGEVAPLASLKASPSLAPDLETLRALASAYAETIFDDVGGVRLDRLALDQELDEALEKGRLVQVRGLAGCGKSVLLKSRVLNATARGATLFLKADQLEGRSWRAFATLHSLSPAPLRNLLAEIGAVGTPTLFVDAIDRAEIEQQPILAEVMRLIASDPELARWKIVVTVRDNGVELLRNWMGDTLEKLGIATVSVEALTDTEAAILADAVPQLRSLLFGPQAVRDIVRRPFFAKVLTRGLAAAGSVFEPRTEIDLADHWWERGGYDSTGREALARQRAILELASVRAAHPSAPIGLRHLCRSSVGEIAGLIADGIVQWVKAGHSLRYSHDIFFEWAFYHRLEDEGEQWVETVRAIGEPPAVARSVELLSQARFASDAGWGDALSALSTGKLRAQWMRAWLLGPVGSSVFLQVAERYWAAVSAAEFRLLKKALVWFQAEKTIPNSNILAAPGLDPDQRQRAADLLGWPSDFAAWMRLIAFLIGRKDEIPTRLYPDLLPIFEVWQRTFGAIAQPTSSAILGCCAGWLESLDERAASQRRGYWDVPQADDGDVTAAATQASPSTRRWKDIDDLKAFHANLLDLILQAAKPYPDHAAAYFQRVLNDEAQLDADITHILSAAPYLAPVHPKLLVDATLKHLRDALPQEKIAADEARNRAAREHRARALAKPEAERTRVDQAAIDGLFLTFGSSHSDVWDWQSLSIDRDLEHFFPVSPLREPFASLFTHAPDEGLRLLRKMCGHAMEAWRQLHALDAEREGTPIPLNIAFPWGEQSFWGGAREYLWYRTMFAPNPLACGLTALENWAYQELDRGAEPDALIRQIVSDNECVAVLGIAATVALERNLVSDASFALITSQRLLLADRRRLAQEYAAGFGSRIEYGQKADKGHGAAMAPIHGRPVRKQDLRRLVPSFLFGDEKRAARLQKAFAAFPDQLPFSYEEQRNNPEAINELRAQAEALTELVDPANYTAYRTETPGEVVVVHESPSANAPEACAKRESALGQLAEQALWGAASAAFEAGQLADVEAFERHLTLAQKLDSPGLYALPEEDIELGVRRGGIAAVAAAVLRFRDGRDANTLAWARDVLFRAIATPRSGGHGSSRAVIPWHEAHFAARGFAADLRAGTGGAEAADALLRLVAHPLEAVAIGAVRETLALWDIDPRLVWAALHMGFALCRLSGRSRAGDANVPSTSDKREETAFLAAKTVYYARDWLPLPLPPPAWIELSRDEARARNYYYDVREADDALDPNRIWAPSPTPWYSHLAGELLKLMPIAALLSSPARGVFLDSISGFLSWTIARNAPPWKKPGRRDRTDANLFEWTHNLGSCLGQMWAELRLADDRARLLDPILEIEGDACWSLLGPLAETFVCCGVYDAPALHPDTADLLLACVDRLLAAEELQRPGRRRGRLSGFDQPKLARALLFVSVDEAPGAARFANGDWSEIDRILPVVDRLVRGAGWAPNIMGYFVTLCEAARNDYSADSFAAQVLQVLGPGDEPPAGWASTTLPARIAGLIQHFANREAPMTPSLAQALLRVLDRLVDMGDRRAAALQLSEAFREVRIGETIKCAAD